MKNFKMLSRAEMRNVAGGNACAVDEYTCGDGTCIPIHFFMDAEVDCPDGSDEGAGAPSPKIDACVGKREGDSCSWMYKGTPSTGKCRSYMAQPLHCSNLL